LPAQWTGEWKLDETSGTQAADISGKANHGTLKNFSTTTNPWVKGKFGNCLSFDGVDDFVEINGNRTVFDALGSPFSIAYWIKAKPQSDKRVYSEGNKTARTGFGGLFTIGSSGGTSGKVRVWFRNDRNAVKFGMDSTATVYDDTWHHVAVVHVSGQVTIYVDGKLDKTGTYGAGAVGFGTFTTDRVGIGAVLRQGPCCLFAGLLDDMRVYDSALSAADVVLVVSGTPLLPCRASVGKYGYGCGGSLTLAATGSAQYGKILGLKLSGGTPGATALLSVGLAVKPQDISIAGFPGCIVYPDLAASILVGIGKLDSSGSSATINVTMPTSTSLGCGIGVVQGVAISGAKLELSAAALAQIGIKETAPARCRRSPAEEFHSSTPEAD
jgi:hypothetical protein